MFSDGRWHDAALVERDELRARADASPARRSSSRATRPRWSSRAGGAASRRSITSCSSASSPRPARARDRHHGRSGAARGVQQPVHERSPSRWALQLQNTAYSVNIKERLDFSCALFDAAGNLIANAPHMPVHLGSMSESIKTVIARNAGTDAARRRLRAQRSVQRRHAPARRHRGHAGLSAKARASCRRSTSARAATTPTSAASRPARCRRSRPRIEEEGVLIDNVQLVEGGRFLEAEMRALLAERPLSVAQPRRRTSPT